ncbi:MAG TPA: hypothetical protein VD903_11890 [Pseudonocardia sp.]|nr:hypothetical protein [Pseudonocardia sp.]
MSTPVTDKMRATMRAAAKHGHAYAHSRTVAALASRGWGVAGGSQGLARGRFVINDAGRAEVRTWR